MSKKSIRRRYITWEKLIMTSWTGNNYTSEQKRFKELAKFDLELYGVQEETFKDTHTTTWRGNYFPISVTSSSKLAEEPTFFCKANPHHLVASFIGALENLLSKAEQKRRTCCGKSTQQ